MAYEHRVPSPQPLVPSSFHLLIDPPAAGAWNMAVDEALLKAAAAEGQSTMRFYRWEEPTLSLGYFQEYADRWNHTASSRCSVVRRASGGGAILHDVELTYSLAIPDRHPLAANRLRTYQAVHETLIETLAPWGIQAGMFPSQQVSQPENCPNFRVNENGTVPLNAGTGARQPFLCFQRRAPGDVLVGEIKIAGSAQRRCLGAVLQHGSVLLARSDAAPELEGLKELTGKVILADRLIEAWSKKISEALTVVWQEGGLCDGSRCRAEALVAEKYASPSWTESRGRGGEKG
jgi:lipoate-protein ligase A